MIPECTAIVMAGGESQRMGCDKASLMLGEQTLLQRVLDIVQPLFPTVRVSVRQPRPDIEWPQIYDEFPRAGPLAGLCAGLEYAKAHHVPWIFLVATDMPFLKTALVEQLAQKRTGFQAVVPKVHGHPQPLAAFYSADCLSTVRTMLECDGRRSLRAALEQLKVCCVDEAEVQLSDPGLRSFFDLDTPQDIAAAKMIRKQTE